MLPPLSSLRNLRPNLGILLALLVGAYSGLVISRYGFNVHNLTTTQNLLRRLNPINRRPLSHNPETISVENLQSELTDRDITGAEVLQGFPESARKVLRIGNMVAKLGPGLDLTEAYSIAFVRDRTSIPVPKPLKVYEKDGYGYILMDFVEGEPLKKAWPNLLPDEKDVIAFELNGYFRELHNISPLGRTLIGSVNGGAAVDRRQLRSISGGPFESEADFNIWQLAQLIPDTPVELLDLFAGAHKTDHKIVFSHGDPGWHNILVREGHVVAILDWEHSGWYPEHWDYCKAIHYLAGTEGYPSLGSAFGGKYPVEYLLDMSLNQWVKHGL